MLMKKNKNVERGGKKEKKSNMSVKKNKNVERAKKKKKKKSNMSVEKEQKH